GGPQTGWPAGVDLLEVVNLAGKMPVEVVEAPMRGPLGLRRVAQLPFADQRGVVTRLTQRLGQQALIGRQAEAAEPLDLQRLKAVAHRVAAGHRRGPRLR